MEQQQKPKVPFYKKWWFIALCVVVVIIIIANASKGSGSETADTTTATGTSASAQAAAQATQYTEGEGDLGDYHIVIKSAAITEDYTGEPAIVITYEYTNNGDDSQSFDIAFLDKAYQNGVECGFATLGSDSEYDTDMASSSIKTGVTIEVVQAYLLNDATTPVEVEVSELISFNDDIIAKTFNIAE